MPRRKNLTIRVTIREKRGKPCLRHRDPITGNEQIRAVVGKYPSEWQREAGAWERELQDKAAKSAADKAAEKRVIENCSWDLFVSRYEHEHLMSLADATFRRYKTVLNAVAEYAKPKLLAELTTSWVSKFHAHLRASGIAEATIASHLNHLRAALQWGKDLDLLAVLPTFPRMKRARKGQRRKPMKGRPVTEAEFKLLLAAVDDKQITTGEESIARWKRFIEGLYWSGLRLEEGLELHWTRLDKMRVDLDSGRHPVLRILSGTEKGNQDRTYPIPPEFAEMLRKTPPAERTGYVFPLVARENRKTRQSKQIGMTYASAKLTAIGKAAGVITHVDPKSGESHYAGAHDLRRAFGNRWARRVLPQLLQQMMRHESIETTLSYYVDLDADDVAGDIWEAYNKAIVSGDKTGDKPQ